jgi:hypothetical protein
MTAFVARYVMLRGLHTERSESLTGAMRQSSTHPNTRNPRSQQSIAKIVQHSWLTKRACHMQAVIGTSSALRLPDFLLLRFATPGDAASGDARACSASAAELLRVLVATGRDFEAVAIVHESIEVWLQASAGLPARAAALWLPYKALSGLMYALERQGLQVEATQLAASLHALRVHECGASNVAVPAQ